MVAIKPVVTTYYTQFSGFETRYKGPCKPIVFGTSDYIYDPSDTAKSWPSISRADLYSNDPHYLKGFKGLFVLDIEHLNRQLDIADPKAIEHIKFGIKMYRDRNPDLLIGLYSILPSYDYWSPLHFDRYPYWANVNAAWIKRNRALRAGFRSLASFVDFVMPEMYQPYRAWSASWPRFADAQIAEAIKYGLPVIPLCWPFYEFDTGQPYVGDEMVKTFHKTIVSNSDCEGICWWHERPEPKSFFDTLNVGVAA